MNGYNIQWQLYLYFLSRMLSNYLECKTSSVSLTRFDKSFLDVNALGPAEPIYFLNKIQFDLG